VDARISRRLRQARVARLATADANGRPHVVPVCFARDGRSFYTPLDLKPKRVRLEELARVRHIRANSNVSLLVDEYSENWEKLWYVLVRGTARLLSKGKELAKAHRLLRTKYPQYRGRLLPEGAPVIRIRAQRIIGWGRL